MGKRSVGATKIVRNWERAVSLEPRLVELEREILALPNPLPEDLDQSAVWSGSADRVGIKSRLMALVGWERRAWSPGTFDAGCQLGRMPADEEWLQSSEAYEAVTIHLAELIPLRWEALAS